MNTIILVIAIVAIVAVFLATPSAPEGCENDHVPFRQVVAAILGVGAGGSGAVGGSDYVALSLIGVALPVLFLRNAELIVGKARGQRAALWVRYASYVLAPAAGYLAAAAF